MLSNHRPSILNRPLRPESRANVESKESQFQKEQDYWRSKGEKQQEIQERLMRSLYPGPEDKVAAHEELLSVEEQRIQARQAERQKAAQIESVFSQPGLSAQVQHRERPWLASTATMTVDADAEAEARRRFASEVAAENQKLIAERQLAARRQLEAERDSIRKSLNEASWFNHAPTESWQKAQQSGRPPTANASEQAARPVSAAPNSVAQRDRERRAEPLWAWNPASESRAAPTQATTAAGEKEYPWSWKH